MSRRQRTRFAGFLVSALVVGVAAFSAAGAGAAADPQPSDSRAQMVAGNVVTCAGAGFATSIQVGAEGSGSASDANVSGSVAVNSGSTQPGVGQEVDVTLLTGTVVIDAVIVKGGPAYNVYSNASFLPPTLNSPQHYISPLNPGGNVPAVSHWFVCYHLGEAPPTGTIVVSKSVGQPDGTPLSPLPTSFTAIVTCDDKAETTSTVTFGASGGIGTAVPPLENLPIGTTCTVVEQDTASFPTGTTVGYIPSDANTAGVTIPDSSEGVQVVITNDFSGVQVVPANVVVPAQPIAAAPAFTG